MLSEPDPQARFSPASQLRAPPMYPAFSMRRMKSVPSGVVWAKKPLETMSRECTIAACSSFGLR